ncbi:MAG: type II secretion system protein [Acidobacteria bacterium]|nr:type II secretion system protein [Acidobacteriota bacterium]MCW5967222.1 type II secretion system protein [Blastocatellales bacterium]
MLRSFERRGAIRKRIAGFTLLEMIITLAILAVLATAAIPLARNDAKRRREQRLKYALYELRQAIDKYKTDCESGMVGPLDRKINDECYPPTLEILVEGINPPNTTRTIKYLREIPIDPITGEKEWGMRSVQDEPLSEGWGGENVWDVYSRSEGTALNGTRYKEW